MSAKHTAGPWHYCRGKTGTGCPCGMVWSKPADFHVATAHKAWGDFPDDPVAEIPVEEMQANAHLIAAAPELLEALEGLIQYVPGGVDRDDIGRPWLKAAFQAIAKARGEA